MWLQDLFCDDPELENYRTMIYGYNTKLSEDGSQTIGSYTDDLLGDLKRMRNLRPKDVSHVDSCTLRSRTRFSYTKKAELTVQAIARKTANNFYWSQLRGHHYCACKPQGARPYMGHTLETNSMKSLVDAKFDDSCHTLLEDTCAIIFLGTPHRGLYVEDIVAMIGTSKKARAELVMSLEAGARGLEKELKRFRYIVANKPLPVLSFCEKLPTRKLVKVSACFQPRCGEIELVLTMEKRDGRWSRSGEPVYSATTNSLMIDLPWPWETPVAVDADHSTIAKVQSRDSLVYRRIEDFLKDHGKSRDQL